MLGSAIGKCLISSTLSSTAALFLQLFCQEDLLYLQTESYQICLQFLPTIHSPFQAPHLCQEDSIRPLDVPVNCARKPSLHQSSPVLPFLTEASPFPVLSVAWLSTWCMLSSAPVDYLMLAGPAYLSQGGPITSHTSGTSIGHATWPHTAATGTERRWWGLAS